MATTLDTPVGAATDRRRWWALAVIGLAQLLIIIDSTIINIALPSVQRELGLTDAARQWTISAYTLAFGGLLLLGGRLADRIGRRTTLLIGIAGFAVASAVGGAANGPAMLIAARAAQGVFAALLAPSTMSLLSLTFTDPKERGKAFGIFSAITMSGAAIGLMAGGALAQYLDWRWCLYVNLPIAAVAMAGGWFVLPRVPGHRDTKIDWTSGLFGSGGIVALVYALSEGATEGWGSAAVLGCLAAAAVLLGLFCRRQTRVANPLLPPSVFADRARTAAYLSIGVASFGMFGMFLFMTYQLQAIMHYGAFAAGLAFMPLMLANVLMSTQVSGKLPTRLGPRPLLAGGLLLMAVGLLVTTRLAPETSYAAVILPAQLLIGFGAGLTMPTVLNVATKGIAARDAGAASAFITTSQQVGASLGTASINTIAASVTAASAGLGATTAIVHGFTTASFWAAGAVGVGAVAVAGLARGRKY